MEISGRITQVEFQPGEFFRVRGMVNSDFNESRIWGGDDGFTMAWFWYDHNLPDEVLAAFKNVISKVDAELQWRGILPKQWPGNLTDTAEENDIFKFKVTNYKISNPKWLNPRDQAHIITINASSEFFTDENDIVKELSLRLKDEELSSLFTALEDNL